MTSRNLLSASSRSSVTRGQIYPAPDVILLEEERASVGVSLSAKIVPKLLKKLCERLARNPSLQKNQMFFCLKIFICDTPEAQGSLD